ncbi:type III pantothenate kinase [Tamlana sp. 62-3]|uniref:Type III pantothenate kinase n=1 Tax=Neotamlana sargassicola TaxID=2883125 RepID=A0A9X1I7X2_9FLAO|nr:type III pantothenate kinase [Tamlana sargassicola]MCB4808963.1 type III pantothenate kinase [Tamlana sargassicola]
MNLVIDVGNTLIKLAVFRNNTLVFKKEVAEHSIKNEIFEIKKHYPTLVTAIISSVGKLEQSTLTFLEGEFTLTVLSVQVRLPFKNLYETPKTLGVDRIALVAAGVNQFPHQNILIIDAGTCITFDFVNSENTYLGGAISPGLQMRYKALHNFTAKLPLLERNVPTELIGTSTNTAIHSGVVYGVLNELEGVINQYKLRYPDLSVILTGGDAKFLSKQLKSSIFALSDFLLEGLNYILQYNINE